MPKIKTKQSRKQATIEEIDPLLVLKQKIKDKDEKLALSTLPIPLHYLDDTKPLLNNYSYLDTFMELISTFGSFNYQLFMFVVNSIQTGADVVLNYSLDLVAPLVIQGYRITKGAMNFLLNVYSVIFQNWVGGAILYAIMFAFPTILYDNLTYILGSTITSYILYPFSSVYVETPSIFSLESPVSLVGMLTIGSILQLHPTVNTITSNIVDVIIKSA